MILVDGGRVLGRDIYQTYMLETWIGGGSNLRKLGGVKILNVHGPLKYRDSTENLQFGVRKSKSSRGNFQGEFPTSSVWYVLAPYPGLRTYQGLARFFFGRFLASNTGAREGHCFLCTKVGLHETLVTVLLTFARGGCANLSPIARQICTKLLVFCFVQHRKGA